MSDARILVVDPDERARQSTADHVSGKLADIGSHNDSVATLTDSRTTRSDGYVDYVVTELKLPDGTGYDFLGYVRSESTNMLTQVSASRIEVRESDDEDHKSELRVRDLPNHPRDWQPFTLEGGGDR